MNLTKYNLTSEELESLLIAHWNGIWSSLAIKAYLKIKSK